METVLPYKDGCHGSSKTFILLCFAVPPVTPGDGLPDRQKIITEKRQCYFPLQQPPERNAPHFERDTNKHPRFLGVLGANVTPAGAALRLSHGTGSIADH
ncbi:hypothetical protein NDU88_010357 [Pleurodeles waltl]|uniref:Uncharacterized protein n=1 Tax=Pleurodeles waltl TaxID=8319 RepID=A0AAV7QY08_PLEWA|nr:hypothetical protein NDU88_010357 [Pleurodeles waltl]